MRKELYFSDFPVSVLYVLLFRDRLLLFQGIVPDVFLTLISLIPCVLYVKVMSEINNVSLVLIALCNVAVFILHRNSLRDMGKITKKATLIASGAVFMLMIFLVASAIPKQQEAPYYDEFEDLFMGGDTSSDIEDSFLT